MEVPIDLKDEEAIRLFLIELLEEIENLSVTVKTQEKLLELLQTKL